MTVAVLVPAALVATSSNTTNTGAWVLFFILVVAWLLAFIGAFTFLTGKAAGHAPNWLLTAFLALVGAILVIWVFAYKLILLIAVVVGLGGYYVWHLLRIISKPGEKIADALSPEIRRDEAAARAAGEVPDAEDDREESQERGDALEHVLDDMEHEAGHEVPQEEA